MDTARDYRILVAEDALNRLEAAVKAWGLPYPVNKHRVLGILRDMRGRLLRLKYSFLPSRMLAESSLLRELEEEAAALRSELLPGIPAKLTAAQRLRVAEIRYSLWIIIGLKRRLLLGEENLPEYAVDVVGVKVTRIEPHPSLERLSVTRASTGTAVLTIVTNIRGIRVGEVRGAALLPPALLGGVVSEAMYATDPLEEETVGRRVSPGLLGGEVRAKVMEIAGSLGKH